MGTLENKAELNQVGIVTSPKVTTTDVFDKIGSFGLFQKLLFLFTVYCVISWACFNDACIYLLIAEPRWQCAENSTVCNITSTIGPGEPNYEQRCTIPRQEWTFVDEYTSLITQFDLICDKATFAPILLTIDSVGGVVGAAGVGFLSDRFGRKKAFFLGGLIGTFALFVLRYAPMYGVAAAVSFLQGITVGGVTGSGYTIIAECVASKHRSLFCNCIWAFYGVGFMIFAGIGYLARDWKNLLLILSLCGLPALLLYRLVPESLRWLIIEKRFDEARCTLKRIAKVNGKVVEENIELPNYDKEKYVNSGDIRLLFRPGFVVRTVVIWYNWFVNGMIYNGLHLIAPNIGGSLYFNWFLAGLSEFVSSLLGVHLYNRFGRKKVAVICQILACLSTLGSVIFTLYDDGSQGFLTGNIIFTMVLAKCFIVTSYNGVGLLTAETYPTSVRNLAIGGGTTFSNVGVVTTGFIAYLVRIHPVLPQAVMTVNAFIGGLLCLAFLKETNNLPIPEEFTEYKNQEKKEDPVVPVDALATSEL